MGTLLTAGRAGPRPPLVRFVTPSARGARLNDRVTAVRWARLLRQLGLRVAIDVTPRVGPADLLVALNACQSAEAVHAFRRAYPGVPVVVALTGSDVYDVLPRTPEACGSLGVADLIVALQPRAGDELAPELRTRLRAIFPSASASPHRQRPADGFVVALLANLRAVRDPLLPARAARRLSAASRIQVVHFGDAVEPALARAVRAESADNPRYEWRAEARPRDALAALAGSDLLVLPSHVEGGPHVVSAAVAAGVPIVATRIGGATGLLGDRYPGLFPVGDAGALARLLERAETETEWRDELSAWGSRLRPVVEPARERAAWAALLDELGVPRPDREPVDEPTTPRLRLVSTPVESELEALSRDVAVGLSARPRHLSCRFLYDREGSALFEAICRTPEYYVTRAEREILEERASEIAALMPPGTLLFELGSGNAEKTRVLLDAFCRAQGRTVYAPVDISREMLEQTADELLAEQSSLEVRAFAGEYAAGLAQLPNLVAPARLVLWLGSNIGNFDRPAAIEFLQRVRERLCPADRVLVGIDLRKPREVLEAAYDDAAGVTARFSKNLLVRINRELDADFDIDAWQHLARWDEEVGRVRIQLVSRRAQVVVVRALGMKAEFAAGEEVHTEDSHKYSPGEIDDLAHRAGLTVLERWTDRAGRFALVLFAPQNA